MFNYLRNWFQTRFSDPNAVTLTILLVIGFSVIIFWGRILAPFLVAIVFAYLLDGPVTLLQRIGIGRFFASVLVFVTFILFMLLFTIFLVPVVWEQSFNLLRELPKIAQAWDQLMEQAQEYAPAFVEPQQVRTFNENMTTRLLTFGETVLAQSLTSIVNAFTLMIYLVIVPLLIFFMLKDKDTLVGHFNRILPKQRRMISQVGIEMNLQIRNYIRGKALEIIIVGVVTYIVFTFFDLRYAALLATLVGFSVLIPYIGAAVVTAPVALVGLFQFGVSATLVWLIVAYLIIQALDGNVLVPLLFSEAVSLHPIYIIASVLVFGAWWGFWGVFFAIPLASLVKAVISAFSEQRRLQEEAEGAEP
ncbi:AI-2E family transporter [Aliidiomarina sedimenti]|uniref:AI-2E family transporter n=1 Tax=Aliidiomarina sedimenti TaxID=1933879 RepID=A0ABY0C1A7_9GAMM|nr:AI-2E family transporter [Aliidiomarina sedimenti]RUO31524.1 AI-2E family transporter [Aliidiomarina sedimenti]